MNQAAVYRHAKELQQARTFAEVPTREELDGLVILQLAAAFDRVHALARHRRVEQERMALSLRLEAVQRVDLMGVLSSGRSATTSGAGAVREQPGVHALRALPAGRCVTVAAV